MINENNWTYTCYMNGNHKAMITIGMSPEQNEPEFFCTVLKNNEQEMFQESFQNLPDASTAINNKYSNIWDFTNLTLKNDSKDSGCSTCVAH